VAILIRRAHHGDHGRLLEIWRAAVESSHHFLTPADVDAYEAVVARYLPLMQDLRVAVDRREVVGFIAQDDGEVHMLFVDPGAQGRGVGTALLDDVASLHDTLRLDVNEQNPSARAFYRAKGFVEIGRSELDTEGRPFPLIHLRRSASAQ
jgi:putative acetyltransferase